MPSPLTSGIGAFGATNVAVTVLAARTLVSVHVAPTQSPLKALKANPAAGVAVQMVDPPELTGLGVHVTVPPVTGLAVAVIAKVLMIGENVAVTVLAASTVTTHAAVPTHAPVQPSKVEVASGVAVSVTDVPLS